MNTDYSNLRLRDCINKIPDMIDYAISLGHKVIAFTEHESISNAVKIEEYYEKIKKEHPDFKCIRGNEIYLCRNGLNSENYESGKDKYYHFVLLAKDAIGHKQIRELSTRAWMRSYTQHRMIRVPTYYQDLIDIIGKNPGHVIASTACLGGFLPTKLIEHLKNPTIGFYKQIINWCKSIESIFLKGNFYLEMQPSNNKEQIAVNKELLNLSKELDVPYIITLDAHYLKKEDSKIHSIYLKSQEGDREVESFYATTYLMGTEELESFFGYFTEDEIQTAYKNIQDISDKCKDYTLKKPLRIPSLPWIKPKATELNNFLLDKIPYLKTFYNSDFEGDKVLALALSEKIMSDIRFQNKETYDEVNENLEATWISSEKNKAHWSAYFLNLQGIIDQCWKAGTIVGPGRGSGVGFLLLYLLDIIQINKLWEHSALFGWRFLNPDRVSVLDVDSDIEGGRRAEVLAHLKNYYGRDRVSNVVTFTIEKSKSAIQTIARGMGIEPDVSLYISSLVPQDRGIQRSLKQCYYGDEKAGFKPISSFIKAMDEYPELWEAAQKVEGLVCRVG